jgi:hypothetical protein
MSHPIAIMGEKSYKAFMRRLDALHKKQLKANKMERPFVGKIISGDPVTMRAAREAGLIKGEPKESTQEELDKAVKTMKDIEEAVEKAREKADGTNYQ